ncbi:FMN-binding protein [Dictyobacter arantiisoli]|uniref:FMN-binding domain-containing protein n=1 Tax=Dictyobacter arantiisoli TaxID=2014874 RepID=A0A5A5T948_9CHLR|nr:FMN-binding protein [Dictyobacter arantiisoli]GCF08011.1 hypothetical protein KDI_15750 [Dictyobacter arantiisoli]
MKKFAVAALIIGAFLIYSILYDHSNAIPFVPTSATETSTATDSTTGSSTTTPTPSSTTGTSSGGLYKNGSYVGSVADAHWGSLQVKAIIKNGKIADVQFLQYPNDRNRSVDINNYADSQLTTEAIQAQSANVDIITGATDTSEAFVQSLSDALTQAKV